MYLVSWQYVWWCPWRFCSWSCLLHTLHTYPPALRSRPHRRSPLSVREDMESLTPVVLESLQPSLSHTRLTALTSHSPRTHTLWGSLYEQRVPSRTTLCMKTTSRVSLDWQCRLQRLVAVRRTQTEMTQFFKRSCKNGTFAIHFDDLIFTTNVIICIFWMSSPWVSMSHCVCLCESYYNYMSLQRQNLAVHPSENEHFYCITFITDGHNPETFSHGALTLISRWQTCYCGIAICGENTLFSGWTENIETR